MFMVIILHSEHMIIVQNKVCALLRDLVCETNIELMIASSVSGCMICASATCPEQCQIQ